jgi:membrane-bound inhibitor of C-type lysozyme
MSMSGAHGLPYSGTVCLPEISMFRLFSALALATLIAGCGSASKAIPMQEFRCDDNTVLSVSFHADEATVVLPNGEIAVLPQQRSGSGFWYASDRYELRGKGNEASWRSNQRPPIQCRTRG